MSGTFEARGENLTAVVKDGKQVGVITKSPSGQIGYSVFGTPHQGNTRNMEEARETVTKIFAA